MTYRLKHPDALESDLREIVESQVTKALAAVDRHGDLGVAGTVHEVRRRCKKLRAVARIVRKAVGDGYPPVNEAFRDAGRILSGPRDAEANTEILVDVLDAVPTALELPDLSPLRSALDAAAGLAVEDVDAEDRLPRARRLIEAGAAHAAAWELDDDGFDAIAGGLRKTYRRARKRYQDCADGADTDALHEWRKRVKYHRYHLRMLHRTAPVLAAAWEQRLHDLSDLLGDDHDLAVLVATLREAPDEHGGADLVDAVTVLADGRRTELQSRALSLGARLFADSPDAAIDRLRGWWDAWESDGPAPERTALAAL